jgi:hypothetical protein
VTRLKNFLLKSFQLLLISSTCAVVTTPISSRAGELETTKVYISNGQLEYVGNLEAVANQQLFDLYDRLAVKPKVLSIRSLGGDVNPGMTLGAWVHAHHLNVRVMEFCMSSCANYVFPAGEEKIVSNFAVIGYHGGPGNVKDLNFNAATQAMYDALTPAEQKTFMDDLAKTTAQLGQSEAAYYRQIGVRADLSSLGQNAKYESLLKASPNAVGWTYSREDFALLGVSNITVINPPWKPGSALHHMVFVSIPVDSAADAKRN